MPGLTKTIVFGHQRAPNNIFRSKIGPSQITQCRGANLTAGITYITPVEVGSVSSAGKSYIEQPQLLGEFLDEYEN